MRNFILSSSLFVFSSLAACASSPADNRTADGSVTLDGGPPSALCLRQSLETGENGYSRVVCEEAFPEAPFIHLPPDEVRDGFTYVYGGVNQDATEFHTATQRYPIADHRPERLRREAMLRGQPGYYAYQVYRARVRGGVIEDVEEYAWIRDIVFQRFLDGLVLEGTVSPRLGTDESDLSLYDYQNPTLPVRIRLGEATGGVSGWPSLARTSGTVENRTTSVTSSTGACLPALTEHGDANPFLPSDGTITIQRYPSMHGFFDDVFTLEIEGISGSNMGAGLFVSVADLIASTPPVFTQANNRIHGAPQHGTTFLLQVVQGGGDPCND
jgi:hypothetical protein